MPPFDAQSLNSLQRLQPRIPTDRDSRLSLRQGPAGHSGVQVGRSVQSRESRKPQVPGRWRDPCATIPSVGIGPAGLAPVIEGYVLAGGHSSRFGVDKATYPIGERPMALWVAEALATHSATVTIVGDPARHGCLGLPVIEDPVPGAGPLAGIVSALENLESPWCLIAACDMPRLGTAPLGSLVREAVCGESQAVLIRTPDGHLQPLCGMYAKSAFEPLNAALKQGIRKVTDALDRVVWQALQTSDPEPFANINRLEDLERHAPRLPIASAAHPKAAAGRRGC